MRRIYRRKRPLDYLLPFLIFVGLGVIGVLGYQLWINIQGAGGDVYFYIATGKAKILQYGTQEWMNAFSGTKLLLGDSVKTSQGSRLVMQFFNGTIVRLGDDTEVTLTDITKKSDTEKIGLTLGHGMIWVDKVRSESVSFSTVEVRTLHLLVSDVGTTFEIESNGVESVRVMKGGVKVNVFADENNRNTPSDVVDVGVGQEIDVDDAMLKAYKNHESPSVLMALSDQFKASDWYIWNTREDQNPTDFARENQTQSGLLQTLVQVQTQETANSTVAVSTQQPLVSQTQAVQATQEIQPTQEIVPTGPLPAPVISQPSTPTYATDKSKVVITGTVQAGTAKVVVHETVGGVTDEYTLGKFKTGDTVFTYNVSESYGNFKSGDNTYLFYAVDKSGKRSDPADIKITYNKPVPVITEALTAPVVLKYNGSGSSTVTVGVVKVDGEIHGAAKVIVNGYTLSKFEPGSTTWTYYANENGGNLKPGVNQYEVYGVGPDGKESDHVTFSITYNKPEVSTQQTTVQSQQSVP